MNFCSLCSEAGFEAPDHQVLPFGNPSSPDRVRRGRPESGKYASPNSGLAWDQAGTSRIIEAHPAANHPGYTGAVVKGMESRSFQPCIVGR